MAELFKPRVKIFDGKQKKFISKTQKILNLSNSRLAIILKVSVRTLTDWKREKFLMSLEALRLLSQKTKIEPPKYKIFKQFWYVEKGARLGGLARYKKYGGSIGDPEYRKKRWHEWWEKEGKYKDSVFLPLSFNKPKFSVELAEFIGIMLGDGGMSKTQLCITLHHKTDLEYSRFVKILIKNLFNVTPAVYHLSKYSVNNIVVSRTELVKFLNTLGLPIGNKIRQKIDIPKWIKNNPKYTIACLRGLVDTDGCVFKHTYQVNGKFYSYNKLSFTTASALLRLSVFNVLKQFGLNPRISQNRDVRLDSQSDMKKYFDLIGSHNPKHLKKYFPVL